MPSDLEFYGSRWKSDIDIRFRAIKLDSIVRFSLHAFEETKMRTKSAVVLAAFVLAIAVPTFALQSGGDGKSSTDAKSAQQDKKNPAGKKKDRARERVRREVRMLDDIYKSGIVTITQHYVTDDKTIAAGTAFKKLFVAAEEKGWHRVRLVDATGEPYDDVNVAEDDFEKRAIKALVSGKPWFEEEEKREGVRHLRVATPIPVVLEKCVMCHDNYADVPKGKAIGALTYTVPINGKLMTPLAKKKRAEAEKQMQKE